MMSLTNIIRWRATGIHKKVVGQADVDRCNQEIARIEREGANKKRKPPAWLMALAKNDWEVEKRLIEAEIKEQQRKAA